MGLAWKAQKRDLSPHWHMWSPANQRLGAWEAEERTGEELSRRWSIGGLSSWEGGPPNPAKSVWT